MVRIPNPVGLAMALEDALEDGSSWYEPIELQFDGLYLLIVGQVEQEDTVMLFLVDTASGRLLGLYTKINGGTHWGEPTGTIFHHVRQFVELTYAGNMALDIRSTGPE